MKVYEKKIITALRAYWEYLTRRIYYVKIGLVELEDGEFKRLKGTQKFYVNAFTDNNGFQKWLLKKYHDCRINAPTTQEDVNFIKVANELKNNILEWEDNGIRKD